MTSTTNDLRSLFQNLDAPFFRFDRNKIEPITWQAKEFPVQIHHEVKVPAIAGSTVKFSFSTQNGDINFSLQYITNKNMTEIIREAIREPSHIEAIKGSYKADYDGVFVFVFDNSYSWFTDKLLTYNIQLVQVRILTTILLYCCVLIENFFIQPAFAMADANRAKQCRKLLSSMSEESKKAKLQLISAKERHVTLISDIASLESRIQALTIELNNKKAIVDAAQKEVDETSQRIKYNEDKKMGLCIR